MINHPGIYIAVGAIGLVTMQYLSWQVFGALHRRKRRNLPPVNPVRLNRWWFLVLSHHLADDLVNGIIDEDLLHIRADFHIQNRMVRPDINPLNPDDRAMVVELAVCCARLIYSLYLTKKGNSI